MSVSYNLNDYDLRVLKSAENEHVPFYKDKVTKVAELLKIQTNKISFANGSLSNDCLEMSLEYNYEFGRSYLKRNLLKTLTIASLMIIPYWETDTLHLKVTLKRGSKTKEFNFQRKIKFVGQILLLPLAPFYSRFTEYERLYDFVLQDAFEDIQKQGWPL
ncbi:MAG: hypothetical protein A2X86_16625 [Bdellovibrionales bacterium GWA2_49_15]|nr:MAG: hypothetical protein A2X86_16625 [Bdellovibrionales bacterium GWA2_49_15]